MSDCRNGDAYMVSESISKQDTDPKYFSKQWIYQVDQNAGQYDSKQVIFDLSGFFNAAKFLSFQEMFLVFPINVVLSAVGTTDLQGGMGSAPIQAGPQSNFESITSQFFGAMKSGDWQIINSMQVQMDGKDVIQLTPNLNFYASFVANTTMSKSDVVKHGPTIGFLPDDENSWMYLRKSALTLDGSAAPPIQQYACGHGIVNNILPPSGAKSLFPLDPYTSFINNGTSSTVANGIQTAVSSSFVGTQNIDKGVNQAFYERMKWRNQFDFSQQSYYPVGTTAATGVSSIYAGSKSCELQASLGNELVNRLLTAPMSICNGITAITPIVSSAGSASNSLLTVNQDSCGTTSFRQLLITGIVRMKDVCNLFSHLPLTRGAYIKLTLNLNLGALEIDNGLKTGGDLVIANTTCTPYYGAITSNTFPGTCPFMLSPLVASGLNGLTAATFPTNSNVQRYPGIAVDNGSCKRSKFRLSVDLVRPGSIHSQLVSGYQPGNHPLTTCRVYVPSIELEPALAELYVKNYKDQVVKYTDVLQFSTSVSSGGNFTYQIANGLVNAKRLIIIPAYSDSTLLGPNEALSPFDSFPGTTAPQASLTDFNVLVANQNVWMRNITYQFENFIEEMSECNAINGGLQTGLTSGIVDFNKWSNNYRYYVCDLSRRLAGDNTPKSLTIVGNSGSTLPMTLYMFVEYERHISLNIETGHMNASSN